MGFEVSGQRFGIDIGRVKETIERSPITRLPLVPDFVAGLINLRGDVVAVIDLARLLNLAPAADHAARILVLRATAQGRPPLLGLLVDRVDDVLSLSPAEVKPVPATLPETVATFFQGVALPADGAPLLLLDVNRLVDCESLRPHRRERKP